MPSQEPHSHFGLLPRPSATFGPQAVALRALHWLPRVYPGNERLQKFISVGIHVCPWQRGFMREIAKSSPEILYKRINLSKVATISALTWVEPWLQLQLTIAYHNGHLFRYVTNQPHKPTRPSIPPGSVNEYHLRLGRQRQVWFIR